MAALEVLKKGNNFTLYKNGDERLIKIDNVRFSYPHFGEMQEQEGESGKKEKSWGGVAMLPKDTHKEAKDAFMEILNALLTKNEAKVEPQNRCIKNGDDKEDENMAGHWLITFKEKDPSRRPGVRDKQGKQYTDSDGNISTEKIDEAFYGGCWGSVLLRPWYFNGKAKNATKTFPKRLCCGFTGVQKLKDDTPFGQGRIDDSDAWGVPSNDSGGDGLDDDDL